MKPILVLVGLLVLASISLEAQASGRCEGESYVSLITTGQAASCGQAIAHVMDDKGCQQVRITNVQQRIKEGEVVAIDGDDTSYCEVKSRRGVYQVMSSSVSGVPVTVILFSTFDR